MGKRWQWQKVAVVEASREMALAMSAASLAALVMGGGGVEGRSQGEEERGWSGDWARLKKKRVREGLGSLGACEGCSFGRQGRYCSCRGLGPQLVKGAAADNTSAASERVVAIAVLSQLVRSAEVLDRTALALALCILMPMLS